MLVHMINCFANETKGGDLMKVKGWEGYEGWSVELEGELDSLAEVLFEEAARISATQCAASSEKADDLLARVYSGLMLLAWRDRSPN
jgi:hypothetical protein